MEIPVTISAFNSGILVAPSMMVRFFFFHGTDADRGKRFDDGRDKPPHTTRDFELLKESTMSTRIGRYKNKKMTAR